MPQQELDLLQLPAGGVAEPRGYAAAGVRRQRGDACAPNRASATDAPEDPSVRDRRCRQPAVNCRLDPNGNREFVEL